MSEKPSLLTRVIWRAIRSSVALGLASWWAATQLDPRWVWLTPVLLALGKALREKFPGKRTDWLPI